MAFFANYRRATQPTCRRAIRAQPTRLLLGLPHLWANRRPGSRNGTPATNATGQSLLPMADPQIITDTALGPITGQRPTAIMPARRPPGWPPRRCPSPTAFCPARTDRPTRAPRSAAQRRKRTNACPPPVPLLFRDRPLDSPGLCAGAALPVWTPPVCLFACLPVCRRLPAHDSSPLSCCHKAFVPGSEPGQANVSTRSPSSSIRG